MQFQLRIAVQLLGVIGQVVRVDDLSQSEYRRALDLAKVLEVIGQCLHQVLDERQAIEEVILLNDIRSGQQPREEDLHAMESQFLVLENIQKTYLYVTKGLPIEFKDVANVQIDLIAHGLDQLAQDPLETFTDR